MRNRFRAAEIDAEPNAEIRRIMLECFGLARYVDQSDLRSDHSDEYGTLYRKSFDDSSEPLVILKVQNSTSEPTEES